MENMAKQKIWIMENMAKQKIWDHEEYGEMEDMDHGGYGEWIMENMVNGSWRIWRNGGMDHGVFSETENMGSRNHGETEE